GRALASARVLRVEDLRRHGTAAGAKLCADGWTRLDRQEYVPDQRTAGVVVLAGRDRDVSRAGAGYASAGSLRNLHPLPRRVPCGGAGPLRRWMDARRAPLFFLSPRRAARADSGGTSCGHGIARLRLRYLPGRVPLECGCANRGGRRTLRPAVRRTR